MSMLANRVRKLEAIAFPGCESGAILFMRVPEGEESSARAEEAIKRIADCDGMLIVTVSPSAAALPIWQICSTDAIPVEVLDEQIEILRRQIAETESLDL